MRDQIEKKKQPWHHRKGRRTLPKARAGIGVEKKKPEDAGKTVWRAGGGKRTPKEARAGLGWQKQVRRVAGRRQTSLEEEARRRKVAHAPSHALTVRRVRCSRQPEKHAWTARGWFSGSGALGKIGDLLQAVLAV